MKALQGAKVLSLVRELRSHMPQVWPKIKIKKKKTTILTDSIVGPQKIRFLTLMCPNGFLTNQARLGNYQKELGSQPSGVCL